MLLVLQVSTGGVDSLLTPGDTARYAVDQPHEIRNLGGVAARGLLVVLHPNLAQVQAAAAAGNAEAQEQLAILASAPRPQ